MHGTISAILRTIPCASDGIYRPANLRAKLANDSESTQTVLYTFHYIPLAAYIVRIVWESLSCPCESQTPKPSLWAQCGGPCTACYSKILQVMICQQLTTMESYGLQFFSTDYYKLLLHYSTIETSAICITTYYYVSLRYKWTH